MVECLYEPQDPPLAPASRAPELPFTAVDPSRRGPYLYVGAGSKFAGLNVLLAGAGSGSPLFWQYWSRTSGEWTSLAVSGPAANLGADGSVNWTAPPDWGVYSVDGGPDLYYVRVRLPNGAVASSPIERLIKTDILLLQYEGDVTAGGQTFAVQPPAPSASLTDLSVD